MLLIISRVVSHTLHTSRNSGASYVYFQVDKVVVLANFYSVPTDEGKRENTGYIATQQSYKAKIKDHVLSHQFKRKSVENQY